MSGSSSGSSVGAPASLSGARVLVTGAAGFIGSHLVDALVERGARVRGLDNYSSGKSGNLAESHARIEMIEGDIRDLPTCRAACAGIDLVFHEAAVGSVPRSIADPATTLGANVGGTANIFVAARETGVRRVIYASSSSVYGDSTRLPKREGEEGEPLSPYAASKVMNEDLAAVFRRCYGMELIGLRYFNVYGPRQDPEGQYAAVIPRFFRAYAAGEAPVIYGDGEQSRDFTFVADAVAANLRAAAAPDRCLGRAYNIAGGHRTTVNELARAIREAVGGGPAPRYEAARSGEVKHSVADISLSREALGYAPTVGLADGISRCRPHYLSQGAAAQERSRSK